MGGGIEESYHNIPKAILYLLKGDYRSPAAERKYHCVVTVSVVLTHGKGNQS